MSEISGLPAADTSPSSALPLPLPIPTLPSAPIISLPTPTPSPLPSSSTLQSWLPLYMRKTDSFLLHLNKILSTPSGTDILLCTLCYSSLLTSNLLSRISIHQLRSTARLLIEKAISLPPNTSLFLPASALPSSNLLVAAARLKILSSLISDVRTFSRLWGLLAIYQWGKGAFSPQKSNEDRLVKRIGQAQVLACAGYQVLENGAYLSAKGVLGWDKNKQKKAGVWGTRCWMVHVGLDILRLGYEYSQREKGETEKEGEKEREHREWMERWWKCMLVNLAYAPLTVHWSLEGGLVTEFWVGLLGSVAGGTGLRYLWKNVK